MYTPRYPSASPAGIPHWSRNWRKHEAIYFHHEHTSSQIEQTCRKRRARFGKHLRALLERPQQQLVFVLNRVRDGPFVVSGFQVPGVEQESSKVVADVIRHVHRDTIEPSEVPGDTPFFRPLVSIIDCGEEQRFF
ncbi:hypothetical protein ASPCAL11256 [Aspergillus calidoustus]|uniref:Uncharacterized protein n=1 Tax=Aspergillus calidoustus TaxID=454130 RepID=A0A0U5GA09_ASPCI|nr:hypothetical protein ASPCAL11256 [Aspergillus calidoustus]